MNQLNSSSLHEYLVEMTFTPFATLLTPAEVTTFAERMAVPTLEKLQQLQATGRILAGGTFLGAAGFLFIVQVGAATELEELLASLPLWPRAQTRVVPLGKFAARTASIAQRLQSARASTPETVKAVGQN
jgi:muconolactone delta-isomerase